MNATADMQPSKVTPASLKGMKTQAQKIVALTAYDYPTARILDHAGIDVLLVGDSLGMSRLGYQSTVPVNLDEMMIHLCAVKRALGRALLVADMPYGAYHISKTETVRNAVKLLKQGGAEAVKLEGGSKRAKLIHQLVQAEIPVMGHIGLTPQSIHILGGYKVQGKTADSAAQLMEDALRVEEAGAFALVLEGIPQELAARITQALAIPTIGIGAGGHCDGQILVIDDLLGLSFLPKPRFVRQYANLRDIIAGAAERYRQDCLSGAFPKDEESYH